MRFDTELVSRTFQGGDAYLNFDLEAEKNYPARIRAGEDYLEVLVGESFEEWENDYISRRRLNSNWEKSFYVEEDMEIAELRENYEEVFEQYSEQVTGLMENQEGSEPLNRVEAALD